MVATRSTPVDFPGGFNGTLRTILVLSTRWFFSPPASSRRGPSPPGFPSVLVLPNPLLATLRVERVPFQPTIMTRCIFMTPSATCWSHLPPLRKPHSSVAPATNCTFWPSATGSQPPSAIRDACHASSSLGLHCAIRLVSLDLEIVLRFNALTGDLTVLG